jgi:succinate dehydrogenase / fumarate reductase iron-sulfur subunit
MKLTFIIQRYNPEVDRQPHHERYEIEAEPNERVLEVLLRIKDTLDRSLSIRRSCGHGVCGSDAMLINGVERLACKTLIKNVVEIEGAVVLITPLRSMPIQRDLYVDQERFFKKYRAVKPFFIAAGLAPEKEFVQSPDSRSAFDDPTKCILCAACYSACPVVAGKRPDFAGPAAIINAARFILDSRDQGPEQRMEALDNNDGVWGCENHFDCTRVCPRGIKVTKAINQTKRSITLYKSGKGRDEIV